MASTTAPPTALDEPTFTRDYLYRALYLRRELLIVTTHNSNNEALFSKPASGSSSASPRDILLLPPLYGANGLTTPPVGSDGTSGDPMLVPDHAWRGIVHIRAPSSPWYRGCFTFYVYFPSRYPFEPPIIELTGPLRSHPLVQERRVLHLDGLASAGAAAGLPSEAATGVTPQGGAVANSSVALSVLGQRFFIPFEEVYAAVDPMRVSVMAVLLQHILRFFYPSEWTAAMEAAAMNAAAARGIGQSTAVNLGQARRDVERRSVTQEVVLGRPFEQYLGTDVMEHFVQLWGTADPAGVGDVSTTVEGNSADWYSREVLPHLMHS
ncbi:hypothetical protein ABL78_6488 [Leptomonas seymouri]|uniref:UBC core domain-containing protein n=1 Tax=Leptomonas seymouri TaxID=5684 RepID=A0A0N0P3S2_LEPSE|nr:hypothetical protein ABL78_6488 [Leptomonas seymouri]|eukprot:KPI84459.1 hypothetical protein ABL78_6488 [Leptomonas seymouri]